MTCEISQVEGGEHSLKISAPFGLGVKVQFLLQYILEEERKTKIKNIILKTPHTGDRESLDRCG